MKSRLAVFAYGSLRYEPRQIGPLVQERIEHPAPFTVEYARSSSSRAGAPTLVPHEPGGAVLGELLVLNLSDSESNRDQVRDLLRLAEKAPPVGFVRTISFDDHPCVFYADFGANITPSPALLARLAVESVAGLARRKEMERNGIRYLRAMIERDVKTPLTDAYRRAVLRSTGAQSLAEAERLAAGGDAQP